MVSKERTIENHNLTANIDVIHVEFHDVEPSNAEMGF